jgi:hypothetical protein
LILAYFNGKVIGRMKREILGALDVKVTCIDSELKMPTGTVYVQDFPEGASGPKEPKIISLGPEKKPQVPVWEILEVKPKQ